MRRGRSSPQGRDERKGRNPVTSRKNRGQSGSFVAPHRQPTDNGQNASSTRRNSGAAKNADDTKETQSTRGSLDGETEQHPQETTEEVMKENEELGSEQDNSSESTQGFDEQNSFEYGDDNFDPAYYADGVAPEEGEHGEDPWYGTQDYYDPNYPSTSTAGEDMTQGYTQGEEAPPYSDETHELEPGGDEDVGNGNNTLYPDGGSDERYEEESLYPAPALPHSAPAHDERLEGERGGDEGEGWGKEELGENRGDSFESLDVKEEGSESGLGKLASMEHADSLVRLRTSSSYRFSHSHRGLNSSTSLKHQSQCKDVAVQVQLLGDTDLKEGKSSEESLLPAMYGRVEKVQELLSVVEGCEMVVEPSWDRPSVEANVYLVDNYGMPQKQPIGPKIRAVDEKTLGSLVNQFSQMPLERIHHYALNGEFAHSLFRDRKLVDILIHIDHRILEKDLPEWKQLAKQLESDTLQSKIMVFMSTLAPMPLKQAVGILLRNYDGIEKPLAIEVVKDKFQDILDASDVLYQFSLDDMLEVVSSPNVKVNSEIDLFWAVLFWVAYDLRTRARHLEQLMSFVRFTCMSSLELMDCARVSNLIKLSRKCKGMLVAANWVCHARETGLEDPLGLPEESKRTCLQFKSAYQPTVAEFDLRYLRYQKLIDACRKADGSSLQSMLWSKRNSLTEIRSVLFADELGEPLTEFSEFFNDEEKHSPLEPLTTTKALPPILKRRTGSSDTDYYFFFDKGPASQVPKTAPSTIADSHPGGSPVVSGQGQGQGQGQVNNDEVIGQSSFPGEDTEQNVDNFPRDTPLPETAQSVDSFTTGTPWLDTEEENTGGEAEGSEEGVGSLMSTTDEGGNFHPHVEDSASSPGYTQEEEEFWQDEGSELKENKEDNKLVPPTVEDGLEVTSSESTDFSYPHAYQSEMYSPDSDENQNRRSFSSYHRLTPFSRAGPKSATRREVCKNTYDSITKDNHFKGVGPTNRSQDLNAMRESDKGPENNSNSNVEIQGRPGAKKRMHNNRGEHRNPVCDSCVCSTEDFHRHERGKSCSQKSERRKSKRNKDTPAGAWELEAYLQTCPKQTDTKKEIDALQLWQSSLLESKESVLLGGNILLPIRKQKMCLSHEKTKHEDIHEVTP
ncbi:uncharacterized protein LOC101863580 [Aplysia californica]|uniref:Uncharacterized protein LOC101863580 n=1 Tax=Aplysia californica TaxID=6500 RepID=A0ABM0ZYD6_APLCA|nr:uncharacterized protein LOC101863580 [Aplysia californica]